MFQKKIKIRLCFYIILEFVFFNHLWLYIYKIIHLSISLSNLSYLYSFYIFFHFLYRSYGRFVLVLLFLINIFFRMDSASTSWVSVRRGLVRAPSATLSSTPASRQRQSLTTNRKPINEAASVFLLLAQQRIFFNSSSKSLTTALTD